MSRRQLMIVFCEKCSAILVRTHTGYVCPRGCGRIQPLAFDLRHGPYPQARRIGNSRCYTLDGLPGKWRTAVMRPSLRTWLAQRNARRPPERTEEGLQIGRRYRRLLWFLPVSPLQQP